MKRVRLLPLYLVSYFNLYDQSLIDIIILKTKDIYLSFSILPLVSDIKRISDKANKLCYKFDKYCITEKWKYCEYCDKF